MYQGFILGRTVPNKTTVAHFTEELFHLLFPVAANEKAFIAFQIEKTIELKTSLKALLLNTLHYSETQTHEIAVTFFNSIPLLTEQLVKDAQFILDYDPAANSLEEIILSYPGFYAIAVYRLAHMLYQQQVKILPRMMSEIAHSKTGIDINAGAHIGCPFFIDHGTGIVVGETTVIGNYVKLYQGVTLGALAVKKEDAAIKRHPTIGDNVVIYAGSTILGGDTTVGHDCIIGGNTWITQSVKPFSVVYHTAQTVIKDRRDFKEPINFII